MRCPACGSEMTRRARVVITLETSDEGDAMAQGATANAWTCSCGATIDDEETSQTTTPDPDAR